MEVPNNNDTKQQLTITCLTQTHLTQNMSLRVSRKSLCGRCQILLNPSHINVTLTLAKLFINLTMQVFSNYQFSKYESHGKVILNKTEVELL